MATHQQRPMPSVLPMDTPPQQPRPVLLWATIGAAFIAFEAVVLARWVFGPNLKPTPPGPDEVSSVHQALYTAIQIVVPVAAVVCLYFWVVRPWWREGRLTTDGMLAISGAMIFFWDMSMNYTSVSLLYNSHLVNRGAWANGSWPTWISPNANNLPEPLFVCIPGYTALVFSQVVFILWLLRKAKARWANLGVFGVIATIFVGLTIVDTIIETLLLRTGLYAYPGGIRGITLFAGHTYQLPLSETVLFGGLGLGAIAVLSYFRDDRGRSLPERGIDQLRIGGERVKTVARFVAIVGICQLSILLTYNIPYQLYALHSQMSPVYLEQPWRLGGVCGPGTNYDCPGPGVPIPRQDSETNRVASNPK